MRQRPEHLIIPPEATTTYSLTNAGVFIDGDIVISQQGCTIGNSDSPSTRPSSRNSAWYSSMDAFPPQERPAGDHYTGQACDDLCNFELCDLEDVGVVGHGSSGVVHKVRCRRNNLLLVKKVIPFDARCEETRKRVCMELRTLYGAGSRYVVKYYQAFLANGAITIVMEYLDGGSLSDILKRVRQLPEPYLAEVARQVLAGLHYLHRELKVMHRDIKPSNLLVSSSGELKISDFGVSGQLDNSVAQCQSWVGTVTYFSPERIRGAPYTADSDVWSLGLSLVELALGRYPYPPPGEERHELAFFDLLEYVVNEPAPQLPGSFTPELRDFVGRCLSKEPAARPSVEQLMSHPWLRRHPRVSLANLVSGNR